VTTIATDGKTVAADGLITGDVVYSRTAKKIFLIGDEIVGTRGDCDLGEAYLNWVRKKYAQNAKPIFPEHVQGDEVVFEALHVSKRGVFTVDGINFSKTRMQSPLAIGSGALVAMGAMANGATPTEAVRVAAKLDLWTGGRITTMRVK
jgi:20S proteasome alpha/beta subunit